MPDTEIFLNGHAVWMGVSQIPLNLPLRKGEEERCRPFVAPLRYCRGVQLPPCLLATIELGGEEKPAEEKADAPAEAKPVETKTG